MTTALDPSHYPHSLEGGQGTEPDERIGQRELPFPSEEEAAETARVDQVAERVRLTYKGLRVAVQGLPTSRSVDPNEKQRAAGLFDAAGASVSMSTLLWDAKESAVKALRSTINKIHRLFHDREFTLPTPLPGLRRIRRDKVVEVDDKLRSLSLQLTADAASLARELPKIVERERERRGQLFRASDYSFDPRNSVRVAWCFPNVSEDTELAELSDDVYQREVQRVRDELRDSVRMAEQQMAEELWGSLAHITDRLANGDNGRRLTFRDSTVNKLFDELSLIETALRDSGLGGERMREAAGKLRDIVGGHDAQSLGPALRTSEAFRERVREQCRELADNLAATAVPEVRRRVLYRPKGRGQDGE